MEGAAAASTTGGRRLFSVSRATWTWPLPAYAKAAAFPMHIHIHLHHPARQGVPPTRTVEPNPP